MKYNPSIHLSVILNYRQMFKEKYGRDCKITDEDIWNIFETIFHDDSNEVQDECRVEAMKEKEDECG